MRGEEGLFDVEAVLQEDEGGVRVIFWQCGKDKVDDCWWDVGDVFGGEEDKVVWREIFSSDVGDGVADLMSALAKFPDTGIKIIGRSDVQNTYQD